MAALKITARLATVNVGFIDISYIGLMISSEIKGKTQNHQMRKFSFLRWHIAIMQTDNVSAP